jgi:hypothetical protein
MVKMAVQIIDEVPKYQCVKLDVLAAASIRDSKKKIDDLVSSLTIAQDAESADQIVITSCVSWERVCMAVREGSRPFTYFYETLFKALGVRLPLTVFEMQLLSAIRVAPTQLHPNVWAFIRGFQIMCKHLEVDVSVENFFYFFQTKGGVTKRRRAVPEYSCSWVYISNRPGSRLVVAFTDSYKDNFKCRFVRVMARARVREENLLCLASGQERFPLYWSWDARSISPVSLSELSVLDQFDVEFLEKFQVNSRVLINNEHDHAFLQGYFGVYCPCNY